MAYFGRYTMDYLSGRIGYPSVPKEQTRNRSTPRHALNHTNTTTSNHNNNNNNTAKRKMNESSAQQRQPENERHLSGPSMRSLPVAATANNKNNNNNSNNSPSHLKENAKKSYEPPLKQQKLSVAVTDELERQSFDDHELGCHCNRPSPVCSSYRYDQRGHQQQLRKQEQIDARLVINEEASKQLLFDSLEICKGALEEIEVINDGRREPFMVLQKAHVLMNIFAMSMLGARETLTDGGIDEARGRMVFDYLQWLWSKPHPDKLLQSQPQLAQNALSLLQIIVGHTTLLEQSDDPRMHQTVRDPGDHISKLWTYMDETVVTWREWMAQGQAARLPSEQQQEGHSPEFDAALLGMCCLLDVNGISRKTPWVVDTMRLLRTHAPIQASFE